MIAQLTDLHIKANGKLAYRKVDTLSALKVAIEHINRFTPPIEHVIISGDLADFGTVEEYELVRTCLDDLNAPISMVPGNHDYRAPMRQVLSALTQFAHEQFNTFYLKRDDSVWIGLDSLVEGHHHGVIERAQLDWLENQLCLEPRLPHILCWHHPPMRVGITHMDRNNLHNSDEVAEVLAPYKQIQGIMCGHVHRPISAFWHDKLVWVGPAINHAVTLNLKENATPSFTLEPPSVRLFDIIDGQVVSHLSFLGDAIDGPHPFFDANGQVLD